MKIEEARIVAHVCGDGWLTSYVEKNSLQIVKGRRYRRKRRRYDIGYCNNEPVLLKQFEDDMKKVFGLKPRRVRTELRFRSKRVFDRISSLGGGKSREWFVSNEVKNSSMKAKKEWIKAFFDDDATIEEKTRRIRVKSVNLKGLKDIRKLLDEFEITSTITGPNVDKTWYITINYKNSELFREKIGFDHPTKKIKLNALKF